MEKARRNELAGSKASIRGSVDAGIDGGEREVARSCNHSFSSFLSLRQLTLKIPAGVQKASKQESGTADYSSPQFHASGRRYRKQRR